MASREMQEDMDSIEGYLKVCGFFLLLFVIILLCGAGREDGAERWP